MKELKEHGFKADGVDRFPKTHSGLTSYQRYHKRSGIYVEMRNRLGDACIGGFEALANNIRTRSVIPAEEGKGSVYYCGYVCK